MEKIYVFEWQIHKFLCQAIRKLFGYANISYSVHQGFRQQQQPTMSDADLEEVVPSALYELC